MAIKIAGTEVINDNKRVLNNESLPDVRPSLLLDFANSKTLDPRITFTRGSTATYWDGKTTAKAEENLFKYSQEFDNAAWGKSANVTATANLTTAPDGTTTADTLVENDTTTDFYYFYQTVTKDSTAKSYTFSTYAKQGSRSWAMITIYDGTNGNRYWFDLATVATGATMTLGSGFSNISHSISDAGNGWCRLEINFTTLTGTNIINFVAPASADNTQTITGVVGQSAIYLWGAQLEQRSSATAYTATTSSPIVKYQPVLQTAASGEARFDHDPVTGESKGLLIEEARTNLFDYSEDLSSLSATQENVSITSDTIVAPDGTLTGDKIIENSANANHQLKINISVTSGTTYTFSFYAKAGERSTVGLRFTSSNSGFTFSAALFDLSSGTVTSDPTGNASIEYVGNGWYRCSDTSTATATANTQVNMFISFGQGNGYDGAYFWGAQLEVGSFPTSYIPTSGSTVTRAVDAAAITGSNFSSWYTQGQGTLFAEVDHFYTSANDNYPRSVSLYGDDINTDIIGFFSADSPSIPYYSSAANIKYNGASQFDAGSLASSTKITGYHKNGLAFEANNFAVTSDGLTPQTDATGVVPYVTKLAMFAAGGYQPVNSGYVKKIAFYPKRLPNATLQAMTEA